MSEKPMTELLRRTGIIDKHIEELEKWRLIDPSNEDVGAKSAGQIVTDLIEEIAEMLEKEPTMRQTLVAPIYSKEPPKCWIRVGGSRFYAIEDELGRLIIDSAVPLVRGDVIVPIEDKDHDFVVLEVEGLYENDRITAKLITIEPESKE